MKLFKGVLFTALVSLSSIANAALITLEKVDITGQSIARSATNFELRDLWSTLEGSATFESLTSFNNVDTGNNTLAKLTISFDMTSDITSIDLMAGLDAGFGAEVFFNGTNLVNRSDDIWWGRSWTNSDVITLSDLALNYGLNTIEFYWAENSNSGPQSIRYSETVGNRLVAENLTLSTANIAETQVSAPGTFGVLMMSLALFAAASRKRAK